MTQYFRALVYGGCRVIHPFDVVTAGGRRGRWMEGGGVEAEISCHSSVPISFRSEDDGGDSTLLMAKITVLIERETIIMTEVMSVVMSGYWLTD